MTLANLLTADYYFGTTTKAESRLLSEIIKDTDPKFLVWAVDQLMSWKNIIYPDNLYHIHGTSDRIFPFKKMFSIIEIPNGGHFMIVNKAKQVEHAILAIINPSHGNP